MQPNIPELPQPGPSWLLAPGENSPDFFAAFARVSVALQQEIRSIVPPLYFSDPENYRDTKRAYPMLVYWASRPFRARTRTELNYDVLNPAALVRVFRSARQRLPDLLVSAENTLAEAGLINLTRYYQARHTPEILDSVQRLSKSRRCLYVLIRSESLLMDGLIGLGGLGMLSAKERAKRVSLFQKRWVLQLRRLYPGSDFSMLAPTLMNAATQALVKFLNRPTKDVASDAGDPEDPESQGAAVEN